MEILARYLVGQGREEGIYELPLKRWVDKGNSHVRPIDFVRAVGEMVAILREYRIETRYRAAARLLQPRKITGHSRR